MIHRDQVGAASQWTQRTTSSSARAPLGQPSPPDSAKTLASASRCWKPAGPTATLIFISRRASRTCSTAQSTGTTRPCRQPGLNGRREYVPRGKVYGGTSSNQRHGLSARASLRLRWLGGAGQSRLGLCRCPALVSQNAAPGTWRVGAAWPWRSNQCGRPARPKSIESSLCGGRARAGIRPPP